MISERLKEAINDQINFEYYSANIYLAMEAYFARENLNGFVNFFKVQIQEENLHASKFFDYLNQVGAGITIKGFPDPKNDYKSPLEVFEAGLKHEQIVTSKINNLMSIANEDRDYASITFLQWFVNEQVEEEDTFNNAIQALKRIGDNPAALYLYDQELAARTFVPPASSAASQN
ncbi:ferritin [Clostridium luticellarii]|jgi:ferritin|uniref:Ferritin n=1 Tax=Clostridium luticellarii TaxID=1691940 RepID=A0A2T0BP25_9CLOT|nr:ferritin [Clostridium luticellarii]MCI1944634.1 ferritin [Clostridium luticellarii]MCI1968133.1 ferritin [Clostridium luticellarii]MCI1994754.1 ferritin [Clostridium luticellarii]MCI2038986.1 ferritin [Clostridium luticellarii]PRR85638.1 Ferritin [Clostridium luticellarii]